MWLNKYSLFIFSFSVIQGESGVPLRLQLEIFNSSDSSLTEEPEYVAGCQVKVFRVGEKVSLATQSIYYLYNYI